MQRYRKNVATQSAGPDPPILDSAEWFSVFCYFATNAVYILITLAVEPSFPK